MSKKMSLKQWLAINGVSSPISDYTIDKTKIPRGLTQRQRKRLEKDTLIAIEEYHTKRNNAIKEYEQLVQDGKIIKPSRIEQTIETANGHPDNSSTQAARRMLEKRGYICINKERGKWIMRNDFENLTREAGKIKAKYPEGTRIELEQMEDSQAIESGTRGTVDFVDDIGQIFMKWDNGRRLALVPNEDKFRILTKEEIKQEESQDCVNKIKKYYSEGNIPKAAEYWNKLFDLYKTPDMPPCKELSRIIMENVKQLHSYTGQIDDKTVYGVTDYLKEQEYIKMGYYSDEEELVEDEPDICD